MPNYLRKIVTLDRLVQIVADLRKPVEITPAGEGSAGLRAKTIVQCHGCFDIVHPGHIRYLEFARTQGDVLIVSITGDAAIDKGDQRPYIPQELRAENLAALEFVDYVVIDPNPTAARLLEAIKPDVYVKGREYAGSDDPRFLAEKAQVESCGGRVITSSGQVVFSSSKLVEAIPKEDDLAGQHLRLVCRRHEIDHSALAQLLGAMRNLRVVILGDIVVERYVLCDAKDIASESPMMSLAELDRHDYLGGAATIAKQCAALGARPLLITALGKDARSDWAAEKLQTAGIDVLAIRDRADLPLKTRFLVDEQKLFKVNRTAVVPLDSIGERKLGVWLEDATRDANAVLVFNSGYGVITPTLLNRLNDLAAKKQFLIAGSQAEPQCDIAALQCLDLLCLSERKLRAATNDFGSGLSTLAYQMLEETQARRMLVTLSKRGLVTFDRRSHDRTSTGWSDRLKSEHLPSFATRVVDRLGCGETILTVSAMALAGGSSLMQAAYLASLAAAFQLSSMGPASVGSELLGAWAQHRPELRGTERIPEATCGPEPALTARERDVYTV